MGGSESSFKAKNLFGSGPHRFRIMPEGVFVASNTDIQGTPTAGSTALGQVELEIHVTGRLVADDEAGLWTLRNAITAELIYPTPGATGCSPASAIEFPFNTAGQPANGTQSTHAPAPFSAPTPLRSSRTSR